MQMIAEERTEAAVAHERAAAHAADTAAAAEMLAEVAANLDEQIVGAAPQHETGASVEAAVPAVPDPTVEAFTADLRLVVTPGQSSRGRVFGPGAGLLGVAAVHDLIYIT